MEITGGGGGGDLKCEDEEWEIIREIWSHLKNVNELSWNVNGKENRVLWLWIVMSLGNKITHRIYFLDLDADRNRS